MTGTRAKRDYLFSLMLKEIEFQKKQLFLNQRVGCFRFSKTLFVEFFNIAFKNTELLEPIFQSATGAANQANIGIKALDNMLLPLPPLQEQHRIVTKIEQLMTLCDGLEQSIQHNQKYTQELLQVALKEALEPR